MRSISLGKSTIRRVLTVTGTLATLAMLVMASACHSNSAQTNAQPLAPAQPVVVAPPPSSPVAAPPPSAMAMPSKEHLAGIGTASVITIHGKVVSVDRPKKQVTLEGPNGKQITVHVYNPYNLAHAKAGDRFVAKFYEIITIVKQKPDPSIPPVSVAEGIVTAEPGQTPGSAFGRSIRVVATVDAVNHTKHTLVIKGPDGAEETVKVNHPFSLKHVHVGDQIVMTLTDVVAVSLKPEV
jgi:hypothetical protein